MKKRIQDMNVDNQRVIVRCDFNVTIKDGKIIDDFKIQKSLKTINYLIDHNCKIILLSHLGKIKTEYDKANNSLEIVALRLNELLNTNVIFSKQTRNLGLEELVLNMKNKDVLLLENTRFEDVPDKLESGCDIQLASYWAGLGDIFVNDAFGSCHRKHASTYGIAKFIPSCIGFLVQEELDNITKYVINAEKPFAILMGGAKIDDKLELMNKLLPKSDKILVTGGLANTCLKVLGFNIGKSISSNDDNILNNVKNMIVNYKDKIMLPFDVIVSSSYDDNNISVKAINEVDNNDEIKDIGPKTIEEYKKIFNASKTIFVNGTSGVYEDVRFANGTKEIFNGLATSLANVVVGGGDAASAARLFNYADKFAYVSTGGGATLDYIIDENLPALEIIPDE